MSVAEIEEAIRALRPEEFRDLRTWIDAYASQRWDEEFEADVRAGRLDPLADEALREHRAGRTRPLQPLTG